MFSLIDNLSVSNNHNIKFQDLISSSSEVLIASPFLMNDFHEFLEELDLEKLNSFILVTTLKPRDKDQIKKVNSLITLLDFFNNKKVKLTIYINNLLHGKVYLFKNHLEYISGIITSANFTDSGLSRNHEWGVEFKDELMLKKLEQDVFNISTIQKLTEDDLIRFLYEIDKYLDLNPTIIEDKIDLDLNKFITNDKHLEYVDDRNYWLKPIGSSENPVLDRNAFNNPVERLDFSKRRPSGVLIGDILITYGVGNGKILSIYEAKSSPYRATEEEIESDSLRRRWPWSVDGINLTQIYGNNWWNYDLFITNLMNQFNKKFPQSVITFRGGKTLGALNFGADKIRLSVHFAKYIIDRVNKRNK